LLIKTIIAIIILLVSIQFIPLDKTNPPVDEKVALKAPSEVMSILKKSCYDCPSNETKWPYYSDIAPVSFFVVSHVNDGRKAMNFSCWDNIDSKIKQERLKRAVITVNNGMMALPSYLYAHDEAKLNREEKKILNAWFKKELNILLPH
jgi:hypothetical protein